MRPIPPRLEDQSSRQEKHRAAGLALLLAAVVAGVVLQIVLVPREAQAARSARLTSAQDQVAAFGPPAPMSPTANHDFLQPRPRPARRARPHAATRSRLGLAQPAAIAEPHASRPARPAIGARPAAPPRDQPPVFRAPSAARAMPGEQVETAIGGLEPARATDSGTEPTLAGQRNEPEAPAGLDRTPTAEHAAPDPARGESRTPAVADQAQGEARMSVLGPGEARQGELLTFAVSVDGVREIAHTPVRLTFDPQVLEFVEAEEGDMLSSDGAPTRFQVGHGGGEGVIDVLVSRTQPGRGLTGSGILFTVTFLAHAPGETPILTAGSSLLDASGHRMRFQTEEIALSVRP